jgi:hypothetical protein
VKVDCKCIREMSLASLVASVARSLERSVKDKWIASSSEMSLTSLVASVARSLERSVNDSKKSRERSRGLSTKIN